MEEVQTDCKYLPFETEEVQLSMTLYIYIVFDLKLNVIIRSDETFCVQSSGVDFFLCTVPLSNYNVQIRGFPFKKSNGKPLH